jgi:hypothetical protein
LSIVFSFQKKIVNEGVILFHADALFVQLPYAQRQYASVGQILLC